MIIGIGIDLVEKSRIEQLVGRQPKFPERILTADELEQFYTLSEKRKIEYLAGRFAAKEAYAKAAGSGIGKRMGFLDIDSNYNKVGKPQIVGPLECKSHLSISHSEHYVVAQVILEKVKLDMAAE